MSEDYEKFHEVPPFKVKADPSILINYEDYPWLRRNKKMTQAKKKWRLSTATIMMIPCQLCNGRVLYHCPFCTCTCYVGEIMIPCQLSTFSEFIWNTLMSYGLALVIPLIPVRSVSTMFSPRTLSRGQPCGPLVPVRLDRLITNL